MDKTQVTVRLTKLKIFFESQNEVEERTITGKLNISDSKKYCQENGGIFISKTDVKETFNVDTVALIQLKEEA